MNFFRLFQEALITFALCLLYIPDTGFARTWTDDTGRTIEADMVSADTESVTVLLNGKEVKIALSRLSEADQKYSAEWLNKKKK